MIDNTAERLADAVQAKQAMERWLGPAFDLVIASYETRRREIRRTTPRETGKMEKLDLAVIVAEAVQAQIQAVVADGKVAADQKQRADQIASLNETQRRFLGIKVR